MKKKEDFARPNARAATLARTRNAKMARSAHCYVRGNTVKFYEWLAKARRGSLPEGPPVWICGDCHTGNLGPVVNAAGKIDIEIRDLDQTVVGNPAHDLIRLGLSLASAARGSDLPGVTTAKMMEAMLESYARSFGPGFRESDLKPPSALRPVSKAAASATWKTLADERIEDAEPTIPLGKKFWPLSQKEKRQIERLFATEEMRKLATLLRTRDDDAAVKVMDAAFWLKGCSSLGRLRFAVLLRVGKRKKPDYCLMDLKEAAKAAALHAARVRMPAKRRGARSRRDAPSFATSRRAHAGRKTARQTGCRARTSAAGPQNRERAFAAARGGRRRGIPGGRGG